MLQSLSAAAGSMNPVDWAVVLAGQSLLCKTIFIWSTVTVKCIIIYCQCRAVSPITWNNIYVKQYWYLCNIDGNLHQYTIFHIQNIINDGQATWYRLFLGINVNCITIHIIQYTIYTTQYIIQYIINASTVTPSSSSTYSGSAPHLWHSWWEPWILETVLLGICYKLYVPIWSSYFPWQFHSLPNPLIKTPMMWSPNSMARLQILQAAPFSQRAKVSALNTFCYHFGFTEGKSLKY